VPPSLIFIFLFYFFNFSKRNCFLLFFNLEGYIYLIETVFRVIFIFLLALRGY
jgi:hypothetical protein